MIHKKMIAVMNDIGAIGKNEKNQAQRFSFRGIDTVYNELHNVMAKHGVFTVPEVLDERSEERQTKNGGTLIYRILKIKYTFFAEDGTSVTCTVIGEGMDSGDKASNKAMSIGHKYALLQAFCIPTEEQKDPDAETHHVEPKFDDRVKHWEKLMKATAHPMVDDLITERSMMADEGKPESQQIEWMTARYKELKK